MKYDLEQLKKLCEAATPGPWKWDWFQLVSDKVEDRAVMDVSGSNKPNKADAAFIVTARTALPELIERVEKLEAFLPSVRALKAAMDKHGAVWVKPYYKEYIEGCKALAALESKVSEK